MAETIKAALLRRKDVEALTGLPRSTIYALMARGEFPAQVRLTGRKAVAWARDEVDGWIAGRIAASKPA